MNDLQLRLSSTPGDAPPVSHSPIGRLLVDQGKIAQRDLQHALKLQRHIDAPLGDIMISEGLIEKKDVLGALAKQARSDSADLERNPPAPEMARTLSAETCMQFGVVPWKEDSNALYIASSSPSQFSALSAALGPQEKPLFPVIVDAAQIRTQQVRLHGPELAERATQRVAAIESCRTWEGRAAARAKWGIAALLGLLLFALSAPVWTITGLVLISALSLCMVSLLKLAALIAHLTPFAATARIKRILPPRSLRRPKPVSQSSMSNLELLPTDSKRADAALRLVGGMQTLKNRGMPLINIDETKFRLPRVSIMVPLLREREIAGQLIRRLSQLTYPKSLLEVVLVLEASDTLTRETISLTKLPDWMSVIEVPEGGGITTKPRALNYALDFCKGSIIGVWDAEDWPEADQIEKVVSRFHEAPDDVVCLQGILDYYNSRSSWLARCFTIEYAMWWRIIMPGIARLGLVVPLGGTTLFFRRQALEDLGGWDAHNVTEDADLGVRLARHGYKTELLPTVTREEATSRAWPWVRQRSRWLKGFLVTYFVHMRHPGQLLNDLGFLRFMGVQTIFLAAVSQFAAAPVLWSFWLTLLGMAHPVALTLGSGFVWALVGIFLAAEILSLVIGLVALRARERRHLIPYLPTMMVYFTLGAVAAYKAIWELVRVPFYWDKTQHGVTRQTDPLPVPRP
jgi:cellulose synthase/poly-beta-1,6-N-acetylglucosamine synthase-like glycosyltransferase